MEEAGVDINDWGISEQQIDDALARLILLAEELPHVKEEDDEIVLVGRHGHRLKMRDVLQRIEQDLGVQMQLVPINGEETHFQIHVTMGTVTLWENPIEPDSVVDSPEKEIEADFSFDSKDFEATNTPSTTSTLKQITEILCYWWQRMRGR